MVNDLYSFTSSEPTISRITPPILKVGTPTGVYKDKQLEDLYELINTQVGGHYLPVMVPKDIELEVIDAM